VCRYSFERRAGCPLSQRAAAKAVFRYAFRTLPSGDKEQKGRLALWPT
jgi:hypothetical protein